MKILIVSNYLFPEISTYLGIKPIYANGWVYAATNAIHRNYDARLGVVSIGGVKDFVKKEINGISYYVIPTNRFPGNYYRKRISKFYRIVNEDFKPDVVHLYGTEFPHSYAYLMTNTHNVVISIQGLVGAYAKYFLGGLNWWDVISNLTLRDVIRGSLFYQKRKFDKIGIDERKCLEMVDYIEGRTNWDRAVSCAINNRAQYFHCPRILRDPFYVSEKWSFEKCNKHTIFISQSHYPVKGAHQVFKALPLILKKYPDTQVVIAGYNQMECKSIKDYIHFGGYSKYLRHLVKKLEIQNHIHYTGPLSAKDICKEYIKAHVFICPSSIENSPNSLAEAQILGTPVIAAYSGGIPDMVTDRVSGFLYRYEEIEMLADIVCKVFEMENYSQLSDAEISVASERHNVDDIRDKLINIYATIMNNEK